MWDKLLAMEIGRWFGGYDVQGRWDGNEGSKGGREGY